MNLFIEFLASHSFIPEFQKCRATILRGPFLSAEAKNRWRSDVSGGTAVFISVYSHIYVYCVIICIYMCICIYMYIYVYVIYIYMCNIYIYISFISVCMCNYTDYTYTHILRHLYLYPRWCISWIMMQQINFRPAQLSTSSEACPAHSASLPLPPAG
jgi:Ca2+/Na+ antiporter